MTILPVATPSRPADVLECEKCAHGSYFSTSFTQCVPIPRAQYTNQQLLWTTAPVCENEACYDFVWNPAVLDWGAGPFSPGPYTEYYLQAEDNTMLLEVPSRAYADNADAVVFCDNADLQIAYKYRDNCGPGVDNPWLLQPGAGAVEMAMAPAGLTLAAIRGGRLLECIACDSGGSGEGAYNSNCVANSNGGICSWCGSTCAASQYLWHPYARVGCRHPRAVTDTKCEPCDVLDISESDVRLVVGCGYTTLFRWDVLSGTPSPTSCAYTGGAQCQDSEGRLLHCSNNYRGRVLMGPAYLPYCPLNHYVSDACLFTPSSVWDGSCCKACAQCAANQKKVTGWLPCSGMTYTDTEKSMCTDLCSTGFYQTADLTCQQCNLACR